MVAAPLGPRATGSDSRGERLNKLRILLLALAYACFWALFVLFPYPSNVVPESYTSYDAAPVFASNVVALVTMALSGGVLVALRDGLAERVAGSTMAVVGSGAALLACGAALIVSAHIGAIPLWMMVAYPAIVAIYGVVVAVTLAAASWRLSSRDNAVMLALSLFLSFLIGEAIVALTDPLPTGDISNPLMPALGGVFLVILGRLGRDAPEPPLSVHALAPSLSGRAAAPAAAILLCYLLGSGAFMSLSSVARGETWFSDGWIHCAIALVTLPGLLPLSPSPHGASGRAAYPWLGFFILCIACLYCTALLYYAAGRPVPGLDPVEPPHGHHAAVGGGSRGHASAGPPLVAGRGCCTHAHRGRRLRHPYRRAYRALSRDRWTRWSMPSCSSRPSP